MRKIVHFSKKKNWFLTEPDLDLLNQQIAEIEGDGWNIISVQSNCNLAGVVSSYTLLIEHEEKGAIQKRHYYSLLQGTKTSGYFVLFLLLSQGYICSVV